MNTSYLISEKKTSHTMKVQGAKKRDISDTLERGRPFVKMHGLRNDFVIVDARQTAYRPSVQETLSICDRHVGIGADELLIIEPARQKSTIHYAFMRILNPDGREVEACGNATRCVAWLFMQESGKSTVTIETLGGTLVCQRKGEKRVNVNMGYLRTHWQDIPLSKKMDTLHLKISAGPLKDPVGMNIGNPHAVFFVKDLKKIDLRQWGPILQSHALFPEEANIGVVQITGEMTIDLSVWERPGKLTTACGTGACAAVAAAHRRGLIDHRKVEVNMPAGRVDVELMEDGSVEMTGPVEVCFTGFLPKLSMPH